MRTCFRVDASLQIGTGHVMRCLTLADALNNKGMECHFICREHPGNMIMQITERGYKVHPVPISKLENEVGLDKNENSHRHWLGESWETDARQTISILEKLTPDWMIVDHYSLDTKWESAIRNFTTKIMVIDDLADRSHDCDLILDQTFGRIAESYKHLVPQHCTVLTGAKYALLRPEFAELREYSLHRRKESKLERILITMGGVDKDNATGQVLSALTQCQLPNDVRVTIVMGKNAPWIDSVKELATDLQWETEVLVDVSDMAQLMADSDLCIGAAGSTAWERCCLGLPTLLLVLASNQWLVARNLEFAGAVRLLGSVSDIDNNLTWCSVVTDFEWLSVSSVSAARIIDGKGIMRTSKIILESI